MKKQQQLYTCTTETVTTIYDCPPIYHIIEFAFPSSRDFTCHCTAV